MKRILTTIALTAMCVSAFAQGKINMVNDSNHLIYFGSTKEADAALLGAKAPGTALPSGTSLLVDLYGGVDANSMTLQQSTVLLTGTPGGFGPRNFSSPNLTTAGTFYTFQVQVRDAAFGTAALAQEGHSYFGFSQIFTMKTGPSLAYFSLVNTSPTSSQSSWAAGTVALPGGGFGAIELQVVPVVVPEPSTFALAGLGAAAMLIFRRRK